MHGKIKISIFYFQWGHLDVVVPPNILDDPEPNGGSMDEGITNEGGQIQLVCIATGVPPPTVSAAVAVAAASSSDDNDGRIVIKLYINYGNTKRRENSSNRIYFK